MWWCQFSQKLAKIYFLSFNQSQWCMDFHMRQCCLVFLHRLCISQLTPLASLTQTDWPYWCKENVETQLASEQMSNVCELVSPGAPLNLLEYYLPLDWLHVYILCNLVRYNIAYHNFANPVTLTTTNIIENGPCHYRALRTTGISKQTHVSSWVAMRSKMLSQTSTDLGDGHSYYTV